jgi:hypothetical protein
VANKRWVVATARGDASRLILFASLGEGVRDHDARQEMLVPDPDAGGHAERDHLRLRLELTNSATANGTASAISTS